MKSSKPPVPFFLLRPSTIDKSKKLILVCCNCKDEKDGNGDTVKFRYATGVSVKYTPPTNKGLIGKGEWDNLKKKVKPAYDMDGKKNKTLLEKFDEVNKAISDLTNEKKPITAQNLKGIISPKQMTVEGSGANENRFVIPYFEATINRRAKTVKRNTIITYYSMLQYLKGFQTEIKRNKSPLNWTDLNMRFFKDFKDYLKSDKVILYTDKFGQKTEKNYIALSDNSTIIMLIVFKDILKEAKDDGLIKSSQFEDLTPENMKLETKPFDFVALNEEEIDQIYNLRNHPEKFENFLPENIKREVDRFVLACNLGLRVSDWWQIKNENIKAKGGRLYLHATEQKTGKKVIIGLSKRAIEIVDRYGRNFPSLHSKTINEWLKIICRLASIDEMIRDEKEKNVPKYKRITTHVARHSFITNAIRRGVPVADIAGMTGQTFATIEKYVKKDIQVNADNYLDRIEGKREVKEKKISSTRLQKVG